MAQDEIGRVFLALGDPTRRDLVARLAEGDASVGELAEPYAMSLQAVSKHVAVLEGAGLVTKTADAQRRTVHLEGQVLALATGWLERYRRRAEERYARLDEVLAEEGSGGTDGIPGPGHEYPGGVMTRKTQIEARTELPTIRVEREFAASMARVFRAHTDPELVALWIGPRSVTTTVDEWDCRPGGAWRYTATADGERHEFRGCFHDVRPADGVLVQTFSYAGFPDSVVLDRLQLTELEAGRTRLVTVSHFEDFTARDQMLASDMETGVSEGYDKLDDLLRQGDSHD